MFARHEIEARALCMPARKCCALLEQLLAQLAAMFSSRSSTRSVTAATTGGMLFENR